MELQQVAQLAYTEATGRAWPYTFDSTDANWVRMVGYISVVLNDWAREGGGNKWESLYDPGLSCGTITATDTFSLPSGFLNLSNRDHDFIYIIQTDGAIRKYKTVPGYQLKFYSSGRRTVFVSGVASIKFSQPFTEESNEYGGTLYVPGSMAPTAPDPTDPSALVQCDDPYYLVYMAAQEWAQPDVTLVQNVPSLISKATNSMTNMELANQRMKTMAQMTPIGGAGNGETW